MLRSGRLRLISHAVCLTLAYLSCPCPHAFGIDLAREAAPGSELLVQDGFHVERIYSVPAAEQGSWVSMTVDDFGRLITSDQNGKLYRVSPPSISGHETKVEPIDVNIGHAQGLLYAFNSLYVMVNGKGSGLYRVRDTDGDDQFDDVELLRALKGGGEHGPHAIVLSPDKQHLFVCAGNHTDEPNAERTRMPRNWSEDQLLPRQWDARGHAAGKLAPGGWIAQVDPDGKEFELFSTGFRNEYDIAFNTEGELFTYDADMEWDVGTPWYRPTRVNHCVSGAEFGWRSGTGKWPKDYPDSLGSVVDIGPGSPTGIAFGTGAKFPHRFQRALYISDWSYGVIYAVHLSSDGASYTGERVPFVSGAPLPVTDVVVNPIDQAMYFTIGGRRTQSGLYRVTYVGKEPTTPALPSTAGYELRQLRRSLEQLHAPGVPEAVTKAWPHLNHADRYIRYAARIALEHQPVDAWSDKALTESDPVRRIHAIIGLARSAAPSGSQPNPALLQRAVDALTAIDWSALTEAQQVDQMRAVSLCLIRLGGKGTAKLNPAVQAKLVGYFDKHYPARSFPLNRDLSQLLAYLEAPLVAQRTVAMMEASPTQEERIHFAYTLRTVKTGWTSELRARYFRWFNTMQSGTRGGASFAGFLNNIRKEAVALLTPQQQQTLKPILEVKPKRAELVAAERSRVVKQWTLDELTKHTQQGLHGRDFARGKRFFTEAGCYKCHRFSGDGGNTGPDLTQLGTRFDIRALLESIVEPSKTISDQYVATQFILEDGRVVTGRVVNMSGKNLSVMENMLDPGKHTGVNRDLVEDRVQSTVSMMPTGLLDTFELDEILDLLAFLRSGGNADHLVFQQRKSAE